MSYQKRREQLMTQLKTSLLEGVVFVPGANLFYFTGLPMQASERLILALITHQDELYLLVPQVERSQVEGMENITQIVSYTDQEGPQKALQYLAEIVSVTRLGMESGAMRIFEWRAMEEAGFQLQVDMSDELQAIRMIKDRQEIEQLQKAVSIAEASLEATLPYIQEGVNELGIAAQLEFEMRTRGSEGVPFPTIVASGFRGALPHGTASNKRIQSGELIVIDFGAIYGGYMADITRTIAVGSINPELRSVYEVVRRAQATAIEQIEPGVTAHAIDLAARTDIIEKGYGAHFTHRTGHGIGLNIHEEPYIKQENTLVLQPGMIFTVEPGIYLPNQAGVRIEDNVVVTKDGYQNLMSFTKELIIV